MCDHSYSIFSILYQVLCRRAPTSKTCCPGHEATVCPREGVSGLMSQIKPILPMMTSLEAGSLLKPPHLKEESVNMLKSPDTLTPAPRQKPLASCSHSRLQIDTSFYDAGEDYWGKQLLSPIQSNIKNEFQT